MNAYYYYNVTGITYTQKDVDDWATMFARCYETAGITNTDRSNMPESQKSLQAEAQLSDYRGQKQGR